jgi:hypothetical protein
MGNLITTSSVLSTLAASAGDISVSGHKVSITGCPTMDYRTIQSEGTGFDASLLEQLQVSTVTPTGAANTTYSLYLTQYVRATGQWVNGYLTHTTDSTTFTATAICNAWRAQLAAQAGFKITGSGTATLILTAQAGSPIFTVTSIAPSSTTITTATTITPVNIASNTTATPSVITFTGAHGLAVGNVITIASASESNLVSGTYRVATVPSGTTATLYSVNGQTPLGGTSTTTATVTLAPQRSRGAYVDLVAAGVTGGTVGGTYSQIPMTYLSYDGTLMGNTESSQKKHTLYVLESATNFSAFSTRITEVYNAFPASGTTYPDPELLSMG